MTDRLPSTGPLGCPRSKTNRYGEIHACQRKEHHLGLHRDQDGFLWADEAVAISRHVVVEHVQYDGTNPFDVGVLIGTSPHPAEHLTSEDYYPLTIPLGAYGTILFPSDHLVRYEDGTVRRLTDTDYNEHWRSNG